MTGMMLITRNFISSYKIKCEDLLEHFFTIDGLSNSVISTAGRDLGLKYNQGVKISHPACTGIRNDNEAAAFEKMLY
jgi:hypothetical protein